MRVRCPNGHPLTVKDQLKGKRVRCPRCKELFRADEVDDEEKKPKPAPKRKVVVNDDDGDFDGGESSEMTPEDRRRNRQRDKRGRLRKVSIGLLLHLIKTWMLTVTIFFKLIANVFLEINQAAAGTRNPDIGRGALELFATLALGFAIITLVLSFASSILGIVGSVYCCMIPKKADARGLAMTSIGFDVVVFVACVVLVFSGMMTPDPEKEARLKEWLGRGAMLGTIASFFSFTVYLRQTALFLKKPDIGTLAWNMLAYLCLIVISLPAIVIGMAFGAGMLAGFLGGIGTLAAFFLIIILWFAGFYHLWFRPTLSILNGLREAIADVT